MTTPSRRLAPRRHLVDRRVAPDPAIVPPPPPPPPTTNEPAGLHLITAEPWLVPIPTATFASIPDGNGWSEAYNTAGHAQVSGGKLVCTFVVGQVAGQAVATIYHPLAGVSKLYIGFSWQCNAGWQDAPDAINKIMNLGIGNSWLWLVMYGGPGNYSFRVGPEFLPSWSYATYDTYHPIVPGTNYFLELLVDTAAHTVSLFVDGLLAKTFSITFPASPNQVQLYAGAGGSGPWKTQTDQFVYGPVRVSGA